VGGGKSDFFIRRCPLKRSRRKEEEMAGLFEERQTLRKEQKWEILKDTE
jgi:hypothetical protein